MDKEGLIAALRVGVVMSYGLRVLILFGNMAKVSYAGVMDLKITSSFVASTLFLLVDPC